MRKHRWGMTLAALGLFVVIAAPAAGQSGESTDIQPATNAKPVAAFQVYTVSEAASTTVLLDGTPSADSDGAIVSYQWSFGDGTSGSGAQVEHTYPRMDTYQVSLVVVDDDGASHITSRRIDLSELEQRSETGQGGSPSPPRAPAPSSAPVGNQIGNRAPEFALPTLDGGVAALSTYLGQVVVLDFFFQSCSGCLSSLPHLQELKAQYEASGLVVIIVVLDRSPAGANALFAGSEYDGFVLVHEHDFSRPTRTAYGVKGTPHAFLIDRTGVIRFSGLPTGLTAELVARWL